MITFHAYSQNDPRWKDSLIGSDTIGNWGCAGTATCAGLRNLSIDITPPEFFERMRKVGGIWENSIAWPHVDKAIPGVRLWRRMDTTENPNPKHQVEEVGESLRKCRAFCSMGMVVMLFVDGNTSDGKPEGTHWVLLVDGADMLIHDPWDGRRSKLSESYKKVYGYCVLIGQPIAYGYPQESGKGSCLAKLMQYEAEPVRLKHYLREAMQHLWN